jgi:hypothetical protein
MSNYTMLLFRVPAGASESDVERIARSVLKAEETRGPGPVDPEKNRRRRELVDALLAACPELDGGEPDYAELARAENISELQAREQHNWWILTGPREGAGIEIVFYDDYVSVDMPSAGGTDQDWRDVWRYLEVLVAKGGFVVWDPQGEDVVDLAAGPFGDRGPVEAAEPKPPAKRRKRRTRQSVEDRDDAGDGEDAGEDDPDVEPEDLRRGGAIAKLINRIIDDAIAAPLAGAGFKRSGRIWRRTLDNGLVHVVEVQWSPRDGGVEGVFGVAAGVYARELAESIALYKPTRSPKEPDCQVRLRPGAHGRNNWRVRVPGLAKPDPDLPGVFGRFFAWLDRRADDKAGGNHEKAARELRDTLTNHTLPVFERLSTMRGVRDELARGPDVYWAAHASLLLGERGEARQLLDRALEKAKGNPEYSAMVREWARKQGLS